MTEHECTDCHRNTEETAFKADRRTRSGFRPRCEPCRTGTRRASLDSVIVLARSLYVQDLAVLAAEVNRLLDVAREPYPTNAFQSAVNEISGPPRMVAFRKRDK